MQDYNQPPELRTAKPGAGVTDHDQAKERPAPAFERACSDEPGMVVLRRYFTPENIAQALDQEPEEPERWDGLS